MDLFVEHFFSYEVMRMSLPYLLRGLGATLLLSVIVVPSGIVFGLLLALAFSLVGRGALRVCLIVWIDLFRAFPPLVLLVFVFYGLPFLGIELGPVSAVALAFLLNTSCYYGEIFRAGLESIQSGQVEAARSTGLGAVQSILLVVLPQAIRNVLPDLVSNTLEVVKLTSLASVVAMPELLRMARVAQGLSFNPTPLVVAAMMYLVLLLPLVRWLNRFHSPARA